MLYIRDGITFDCGQLRYKFQKLNQKIIIFTTKIAVYYKSSIVLNY